ncbi:Zinc finger protein 233, partial [Stegodyphus mimosarum]
MGKNVPVFGSITKSPEHTAERIYCPVCQFTSMSAVELRTHIASHVGFKPPFKCPVCFKTFSNKYNVQTHIVIHTGERPFKCNICFKSFKQKSHMHAHQKN